MAADFNKFAATGWDSAANQTRRSYVAIPPMVGRRFGLSRVRIRAKGALGVSR
jgi:hypothetical protein